jgi:hypothetical protein
MKTQTQEVTENIELQKEADIAIDNMVALMERQCKDMRPDQSAAWLLGYVFRGEQKTPYVRDNTINESPSGIMNYNHTKRRRPSMRKQIS